MPGGAKSGFFWLIFLPGEKEVTAGPTKAFQLTYPAMRNGGSLQTFDKSGALVGRLEKGQALGLGVG